VLQFPGDQGRQVLPALAQRRNDQREAVEALVEVFPEQPLPDPLPQRHVACRHNTHVGPTDDFGTEPFELAVLDRPQDLGLREGLMSAISSRKSVPPSATSNFRAAHDRRR